MTKKKIEIISFIIIIMCTIVYCVIDYRQNKRIQQEKMDTIHRLELEYVVYVTSGKRFLKDEEEISPEFDAGYVIMQVALYNECIDRGVQKGEKISGYMEVQEEFDDFVSGRRTLEECRAINALFHFEHAENCYGFDENAELGIRYNYNDYISSVKDELKKNKGIEYFSFKECSNSEMEAASEIAAKKWCDYMEGK